MPIYPKPQFYLLEVGLHVSVAIVFFLFKSWFHVLTTTTLNMSTGDIVFGPVKTRVDR
jgi:hypothetical protein